MEELRNRLIEFVFIERNWKLKQAASFFELSIGTLSKVLNGKQNLNKRNQARVKKLLGIQ